MTIKELIEALKKMPEENEILIGKDEEPLSMIGEGFIFNPEEDDYSPVTRLF